MTVAPLAERETAVYRLFGKYGLLLYVGESFNPDGRLRQHSEKAWWPQVIYKTVHWYPDRATALRYESQAIDTEAPVYNRTRRGRRLTDGALHSVGEGLAPRHVPSRNLPDLTAAELGQLMKLTERQVKDRVAKGRFICHWRGGTEKNPRGMFFTPEDVEHNRNTGASYVLGATDPNAA